MTTLTTDPRPLDGATTAAPAGKPRLGEELPIFCERCGYSLHGLPQTRCRECTILQFHCPECGHRQPINTLRPAAQRVLARLRSAALVLVMLFKITFFGMLLFAWMMAGVEGSYEHDLVQIPPATPGAPPQYLSQWTNAQITLDHCIGFGIFGLGFGAVGRMLLLRFRRGIFVGAVLAALVAAMLLLGAHLARAFEDDPMPSPYTLDWMLVIALAGVSVMVGAATVWGLWSLLARVFLPQRAAAALLDWQCSLSDRAAALGRDRFAASDGAGSP